jgi:hypothetical protein
MKQLLIAIGIAGVVVAFAAPMFAVGKNSAIVRPTADQARLDAIHRRNLQLSQRALKDLRSGDQARMAAASRFARDLAPDDLNRYAFAKVLASQGRVEEAFAIAKPVAHQGKYDIDVSRLRIHAELAAKAGDQTEESWALDRMSEEGQVRVYQEMIEETLANSTLTPEYKNRYLNRRIDAAVEMFPRHKAELEAMRSRLRSRVP